MLGVVLAAAVGIAAAETTQTQTRRPASKTKIECPANYDKGSAACKRAKANHKCPEQLGGKCLAQKR